MKISKIECPRCGSENTFLKEHNRDSIWDDEFNKLLDNEYPDLPKHEDYIIYKCKCENCNEYFKIKVTLKCEAKSIEFLNY
jgi:Zn finger protein HypA/HybF involved in hydrogenase expression